MNSLHRGYNFDLDRYGWHSTDYQGVLLTVARVRSTTPRYSINQLGRRCQQRCLNSGHVIRQQPSWTANVEPLPLFPSRIYIHCWWKIDDSTVRVSTTDRHQPSETDSRPISFFLLLFLSPISSHFSLSPSLSSFFCRLTLAQFFAPRAQRNLRSLPWHCTKTIIRFNTYTRDACNDKFHPLDDVPPPFPLPIFYSFSSFSRIGMPLTSFNLLGLACFNRTIMAVRIAKDKQESLIELWKSVRDINWF